MRYPFIFLVLVVAMLSLGGCGGTPVATTPSPGSARPNQMPPANPNITPPTIQATLTGNRWILVSYGPIETPSFAVKDREAYLRFTESGEVNGNTGCNNFGGVYTLDGGSISLGNLALTMMACESPLGEQESEVLEALQAPMRYVIEDRLLKIFYANGEKVLIYAADLPKL